MLKVNNRNIRARRETCSKLTITIPERCQWRRFDVFIDNFEHISHLYSSVSIVNFEQVNAGRGTILNKDYWIFLAKIVSRFDPLTVFAKRPPS